MSVDVRKVRIGALIVMYALMLAMLSLASAHPINGWPLMVTIVTSNMLGGVLTAAAIGVWLGKL